MRPEIDLFVNELSERLSEASRDALGYNLSLLENLTITSSANFNFGNLSGSPEYLAGTFEYDEAFLEQFSDEADIIKLPETEQQDICAWPAIVHELGHTVFREFDLYHDSEFQSIPENLSKERIQQLRDRGVRLTDEQVKAISVYYGEWAQEIFCDLFAASALGPMFLISLAQHALFWTTHSVQKPSEHYPPIALRLEELGKFLMRTNSEISKDAVSSVSGITSARSLIDRTFRSDDARIIELDGVGEMPSRDHVAKIFSSISGTGVFKKICGDRPEICADRVADLYARVGQGQNIAASRIQRAGKNEDDGISDKYAQIAEHPSDFFEMMTAAVFFQGGVKMSRTTQTRDMFRGDTDPNSYLDRLARSFSLSDLGQGDFLSAATGFIHNSDHLIIRSLEANMIMRQLISGRGEV
ncbi:hypothetical protein [Rhodovulum sp. P5]|uniref:hypothetical protein n=1 Tax=Rhodovulum sp. P5 TaxID=1564506 RepID=UPI0012EBFDA8|nr:hypothetical protein [Rhodovulum sp. P5]